MADIITKKPKSEQTKQNIIDTYLKLIPSKCWDKITVKELCAQANITRGTFYQYYSDIYDLMEQIENTLLDDVNRFYNAASKSQPSSSYSTGKFEDSFDYAPGIFSHIEVLSERVSFSRIEVYVLHPL